MILYYITLYYIVLHDIILYYIVLYYITLHCIPFYYIILYYIILYYIILYYIILYYIILYCICICLFVDEGVQRRFLLGFCLKAGGHGGLGVGLGGVGLRHHQHGGAAVAREGPGGHEALRLRGASAR